ncbi:peptidase domain-containing ABC transporter [Flavobacterium crassostreae]|uniref:ABC transporter ATP-binding protein n=1 Tax=Flavobacterium crassostreae TaxID=1763534 RepID=A0A1B9E7R6_9FLAO|nr:peptidase domain-containing ABC transporter [Flavobacterium crassostreae]OCB77908.1 ABC transporter ATP-binding protein [Flavobacterium crassostreae]
MFKSFPYYKQLEGKDCGPTCLKIIAEFYGKSISINYIRGLCSTTREGSSMLGIIEASEKLNLNTFATKINFNTLLEAPLPCIILWDRYHYVIVHKIKKNNIYIADPAIGKIKYQKNYFIKKWINVVDANDETEEGLAVFFEPTENFSSAAYDKEDEKFNPLKFLKKYLLKHKKLVLFLILFLTIENGLLIFFPFLTKNIVDKGIEPKNLNYINLILLAQLMIFIGLTTAQILRSRILLHLSTRINITIVSDFFIKLMKLPISFFDSRLTGDIMQRIRDNSRIEQFLTGNSLNTFFSLIQFFIFGGILIYYNFIIFLIFFSGSILYLSWLFFFLKKRKLLDYERFSHTSEEQSKILELITGMQEIKINNAENQKRKGWEEIQEKLYKIKLKLLNIEQWQLVGSSFISQLKDIIITFFSATLVIKGELTLGIMLSIQYIVGQLNAPLFQLVAFVRTAQDTKISLERLNEIHSKINEDEYLKQKSIDIKNKNIILNNITFNYTGNPNYVLKNLNLIIPKNNITAIVGTSGSGKTTLLKMIMKFYTPNAGTIFLDNINIENVTSYNWRENCGVVMQDGFIFNDSIANNITVGFENIDIDKLEYAIKVANIKEFIEDLPLKLNTQIGADGSGISGGQKQRILIARAVYKNPQYLFFDEATSALDAENEKTIHNNLQQFFKGKTVLIIAHRLSTVKNADQIIVLKNGEISEIGNHEQLVQNKADYFNLVKNQLELGN